MVLAEQETVRVGGRRRLAGAALLVAVVLGSASARAGTAGPRMKDEYAVKAAFLYNFGNFVTWSAGEGEQDEPFVIGIVGEDPFGQFIDQAVRGRKVKGRLVQIRRVAGTDGLVGCRILFIAGLSSSETAELLDSLSGWPVLTVGETERFAQSGGMIGFNVRDRKIRLQINRAAAERAGLRFSSKLLSLSELVEETK